MISANWPLLSSRISPATPSKRMVSVFSVRVVLTWKVPASSRVIPMFWRKSRLVCKAMTPQNFGIGMLPGKLSSLTPGTPKSPRNSPRETASERSVLTSSTNNPATEPRLPRAITLKVPLKESWNRAPIKLPASSSWRTASKSTSPRISIIGSPVRPAPSNWKPPVRRMKKAVAGLRT